MSKQIQSLTQEAEGKAAERVMLDEVTRCFCAGEPRARSEEDLGWQTRHAAKACKSEVMSSKQCTGGAAPGNEISGTAVKKREEADREAVPATPL